MPLAAATASCQGFLDVRRTSRRFQPLTGRPRLLAMQYPTATEATPQPPDLPTGQKASQPFRTGFLMPSQRRFARRRFRPQHERPLLDSKKCPAPPVARQRAATALPRTPPRLARGLHHVRARLLLRPHSQTSAFSFAIEFAKVVPAPKCRKGNRDAVGPNHLPDRGQAPATKPAPEVLPALVMPFAS
jgi:hypothetical protein